MIELTLNLLDNKQKATTIDKKFLHIILSSVTNHVE
jgi:hypothetical protein